MRGLTVQAVAGPTRCGCGSPAPEPQPRYPDGMRASNRVWKVVGLASLVGVVATGALIARSERERRSYTPDEVRDRLQKRLAESPPGSVTPDHAAVGDLETLGH